MRRARYKDTDPGGFFDLSTIKGTARAMVAVLLCVLMLWNVDWIFTWLYGWLGIDYVPATESMVRVRRFWAKVFLLACLFLVAETYYGFISTEETQ